MTTVLPSFANLRNTIAPNNANDIGTIYGYVDFNDQSGSGWSNNVYTLDLSQVLNQYPFFKPQSFLCQNYNACDLLMSIQTGLAAGIGLTALGNRQITPGFQTPVRAASTVQGPVFSNSPTLRMTFANNASNPAYVFAPIFYAITNFPLALRQDSLLSGQFSSVVTEYTPVSGNNTLFTNTTNTAIKLNKVKFSYLTLNYYGTARLHGRLAVCDASGNTIQNIAAIDMLFTDNYVLDNSFEFVNADIFMMPGWQILLVVTDPDGLPSQDFIVNAEFQYQETLIV